MTAAPVTDEGGRRNAFQSTDNLSVSSIGNRSQKLRLSNNNKKKSELEEITEEVIGELRKDSQFFHDPNPRVIDWPLFDLEGKICTEYPPKCIRDA